MFRIYRAKLDMASSGIYLGFDFGYKHIGVACGQSHTKSARPVTTLKAQNGAPDWEVIRDLIALWQPKAFVVGIPLNMDGTNQAVAQAARRFGNRLHGRFQLPVHKAEERLTTQEARARIFDHFGYQGLQKQYIDAFAASLILQEWLQH
jgi:putative Holliday junction resolvase